AVARVEFRIELREALAIDPAREGIGAVLDRPALEAAQALQHVLRPADRFAELTVAHDVDAGLGLLAHDVGDGGSEAFLIGDLVERLAGLLEPQESLQRLGPDEAAHVGGEDAVRAVLHGLNLPAHHSHASPTSSVATVSGAPTLKYSQKPMRMPRLAAR